MDNGKRSFTEIRIIAYGLTFLYAVSFVMYWQTYPIAEFNAYAIILMFLFSILCVGSLALAGQKEWGRFVVVLANAVLFCYMGFLNILFSDFVPISYVFLAVIVFLFLNQRKIKMMVIKKSPKDWKSILIIDDDEAHIKMIRQILINAGYAVLTANSGEDGLTIVRNQKPDLILLDVILPGIKGREVCRTVKEDPALFHIPVIFLTAKDSPDDIQAELSAGGQAHITKPVNSKELLKTIGKYLNIN